MSKVKKVKDEIEILANFEQKNHKIKIKLNSTIGELKQQIFTFLQIDTLTYSLLYKREKLSLTDGRIITILFGNDKFPLLFVLKKSAIHSVPIISNTAKIHTKLSNEQFLFELNQFFIDKNINFNAKILSQTKGIFEVKFPNSNVCRDFIHYFQSKTKVDPYKQKQNSVFIPTHRINYHAVSHCNLSQISQNNKYPFLRNKSFDNKYVVEKYRTPEEEARLEKYLDKVNWINKKGFISSVGHYSSKEHFLKNYVGMTPSLPPLLHKFRNVDKDKWITKKGFC